MARTSPSCTGATPEDRYESRRLTDDILVMGNPDIGYFLYRGLRDRTVPLAGETLDRAYYNAAMGLQRECRRMSEITTGDLSLPAFMANGLSGRRKLKLRSLS